MSLRETNIILKINILVLIILVMVSLMGVFDNVESRLVEIMTNTPLPNGYFQFFIIIGFSLPMLIRVIYRKHDKVRQLLGPYLWLLIGQILTEILLVLIVGKGLGVIVGLLFSVIRLIQINEFIHIQNIPYSLNMFFKALFLLWGTNVMHILVNRIYPLVTG